MGRFLNADCYTTTGSFLGYNMYAYCENNPVSFSDYTGERLDYHRDKGGMICYTDSGKRVKAKHGGGGRTFGRHGKSYSWNNCLDSLDGISTNNKIINDQNGITGNCFKLGDYSVSYNGCEAIAMHNAMVLKGYSSCLSDRIDDIETGNYFLILDDGSLGTNPYTIGRMMNNNGISCDKINYGDFFKPGVYIVSYGTRNYTIHTVAFSYNGSNFQVYNLYGDGEVYNYSPIDFIHIEMNYCGGYYFGE